jgi:hypothetical protein
MGSDEECSEEFDDELDEDLEDEDPDPADEALIWASADYGGVMTYGGEVTILLGRWGSEFQIRHYVHEEDFPPEGELRWTSKPTDGIDDAYAALFDDGLDVIISWDFIWFRARRECFEAWARREAAAGRAPWSTADIEALRRRVPVVAENLIEPEDRVAAVLAAGEPKSDPDRLIWWAAALADRGCLLDSSGGLDRAA